MNLPTVAPKDQLKTLIQLRRYEDAFILCKSIDKPDEWNMLGKAAIADLDIAFGKRFFLLVETY